MVKPGSSGRTSGHASRSGDGALVHTTVGRPELRPERFEGSFGSTEQPRGRVRSALEGGHCAKPAHGLGNAALVAKPPELDDRLDLARRVVHSQLFERRTRALGPERRLPGSRLLQTEARQKETGHDESEESRGRHRPQAPTDAQSHCV